ncbi:potassium-transporting ATPase subunit KdpC [Subtercola boreus]|uniref:Potassium-transporting ATPase KdpC subunit n=1 Tax=Subtercola boreus TaxID=120213 RepID=A0A3E0WCW0_9MICO|nr:potassium-transporting ATPase subunit KdpC [Subtercola boreus]RFA21141.1 potassium-transporting ATPase subunit C [Subtercola boreus]RFA21524.1 potassium-transporting ATPase subunit C [Subtercola boreus]RFA27494.1 potassium-transporting ATPase subunit C [Subtercola boreus]
MSTTSRTAGRQYWVALRAMIVFTAVLGVAYTLLITGIGQLALPAQANGSLVRSGDAVVGSALIGQSFTDADGNALPEWFQSRPSAAGDGYDGAASSGSNYGPENADLLAAIADRKAAIVASDGVTEDQIPADALTASASGLDPHISPEYAQLQVERVAAARSLPVEEVQKVVDRAIQAPDLGYLGEPTVNVLQLNIALAELAG